MKPEEFTEIKLWDWLKTKSINVKEVYFNRKNELNWKVFTTSGINKKPDFIISFDRGYGIEYLAVEIKNSQNSRDVHDSGKILMYYENYLKGNTKYLVNENEIKINHFAVATECSIDGHLFLEDANIISNEKSGDEWRETNQKYGFIPQFEYERTSDYLRRLWSEWRNLKKRIDITSAPSIRIIISNPKKDNYPYLFTMIQTIWLNKSTWKQRFWRL